MELTNDDGRWVVYGDHEDWKTISEEITTTGRWSIYKTGVFKYLPTGKFYQLEWSEGATEDQDERPFQYDEPDPIEVEPVEVVRIEYRPVNPKEKIEDYEVS